jgi:hypothetical protein
VRQVEAFRRYYFAVTAFLLLALTVVAFADNLFTDIHQPSNSDPKFIIHGLLCGVWVMLLFVQTSLISTANVGLHRRLGFLGVAIAIGVTISTIWVFVAVWKGWEAMNPEARANRFLLPSYSVFVALAFANRIRPAWHKRFMFAGTLFMLGPVLGRSFDPLAVPLMIGFTEQQIESAFLPWFFSTWLAFFVSLIGYDVLTLRKVHSVTLAALFWFGIVWAIAIFS